MQAIPAESVDCIWTDPPYNLSNDGITCVAGRMVKVNMGFLGPGHGSVSRAFYARAPFVAHILGEGYRVPLPPSSASM
jgi:hypothetical protein